MNKGEEFHPLEILPALPMRVATAAVAAKDPYTSPSEWLLLIVRLLQERDPLVKELRAKASEANATSQEGRLGGAYVRNGGY